MACFQPLHAYHASEADSEGKRAISFSRPKGDSRMVKLSCGQCIGCRLERSRQWALRCSHEASMYDENCFITLTYREDALPPLGSLDKRHFQLFMKRLRKRYPKKTIRYFQCGEYGEKLSRPHYHACLFNHDFDDKKLFKVEGENRLYVSEKLTQLWPYGYSTVGAVTFESAAYVARYVTKKMTV